MRRSAVLVLLACAVAACGAQAPRATVPGLGADLDAALARRPLAAGQAIRVDEVARTAAASVHLVQAAGPETPHRHRRHDLTVGVLRGGGTLTLEDGAVAMRAGDVAFVPAGRLHWFAPDAGERAVALVVFSPPFDGGDAEPAAGAPADAAPGAPASRTAPIAGPPAR